MFLFSFIIATLKVAKSTPMNSSECLHEFTGSIIKEETIKPIPKKGLPKTGVYEAEESYPGYYGLEDEGMGTNFIYLTTKKTHSYEEIKRMESRIKKHCDYNFDLASGSLDIYNSLRPTIRIKYLDSYDNLKDLQMFMKDEHIKFEKREKGVHNKTLIKTDKVFLVKEMEDGIYLDQDEEEIAYIRLAKHLKWKEFESLTKQVKNNWSGKGFDAALAHFNRYKSIEELVRIYSKDLNIEFLKNIQKAYQHHIKK